MTTTDKIKKILTGLGVSYGSVALLVIALGVLNVLNSIPFASSALEVAGLYFLFLNRSKVPEVYEKIKSTFTQEDLEAVKALLSNLPTKKKVE